MDQGYGFLRDLATNFQPKPTDTFVPAPLINQYQLREGLFIEGKGKRKDTKSTNLRLNTIDALEGVPLARYKAPPSLQERVSINPDERFNLTLGPGDLMGRSLDMIVPMGRGQRGLVIAPPKTGKTTILQHMANAITTHHPDARVFVLLVDERPEEVTDFRRRLEKAHVLFSSADQNIAQHMRITRLAMNSAIRHAEAGRDAVVFIDSLTRLARAFNADTPSHGKTMSGGLGAKALEIPRQIFGAARNVENGGSLTIVATILIETGSRMDDIIYQEFKGTGNMDLVLSRACAEQRIWPAIHIHQSGTRKEEQLLDREAYRASIEMRRALSRFDECGAMEALLGHLKNS